MNDQLTLRDRVISSTRRTLKFNDIQLLMDESRLDNYDNISKRGKTSFPSLPLASILVDTMGDHQQMAANQQIDVKIEGDCLNHSNRSRDSDQKQTDTIVSQKKKPFMRKGSANPKGRQIRNVQSLDRFEKHVETE